MVNTIKQIQGTLKFPMFLKRYVDNGGITRYDLINLSRDNYSKKTFYSKKEVINYFNK
jgi:hypothetical protein